MSDFFNYTFDIVNPDAITQNGNGGFSTTAPVSVPKTRKPISYFFTDIDGINVQNPEQAFGPLGATDDEKSKRFRVTNTFNAKTGVEASAYAVTRGLLFFAPHGDDTDKINIFLKPVTSNSNIGIKIKYFVYRGVLIKKLFEKSTINVNDYIIPKADTVDFVQRLWKEYAEFNKLDINDSSVSFSAKEIGLDPTNPTDVKLLKKYFKKGPYNLPIVNEGERIGYFAPEFGFEIVIDDGDHEQDTSDTGLSLDYNTNKTKEEDRKNIDFARAKKCILDVRKYDNFPTTNLLDKDYVWGFNNKSVHEKIFRENIYHFLDVAAFYGSHATGEGENDKLKGGKITAKNIAGTETNYITFSEVESLVNKINTTKKIYFYVKSTRGRSYNFYKNDKKIRIFQTEVDFVTNTWPILIKNNFSKDSSLGFNTNKGNIISSNVILKYTELDKSYSAYQFSNAIHDYKLLLPIIGNTNNLSFIVYVVFNDGIENMQNSLFGPVNLNSIFEKEDFADNVAQRSWVSHLKPTLISEGENVGLYNTKVVLDGDLISSNQNFTGASSDLSTNLRTYILLPVETNAENLNGSEVPKDKIPLITAGYAVLPKEEEKTTDNDPVKNYCKDIYGGGEIWAGTINDSGEIKSLVYRSDNNDDLPIYQLGLSQKDFNILKDRVYATDANATNLFFHLEEDTNSTASNFIKYKLKIQFDKADGTPGIPPNVDTNDEENVDYISLYTIDGYFYFTKDYSNNFKFHKVFANIAVDFVPYNLSTYNNGYECGFDYIGFEERENYKDIIGNYYNKTNGIIQYPKDGETIFKPLILDYFKLLKSNYNAKPSSWRTSFPFHTDSFITLYDGSITTINCKITKKTNPSKLFYRYNAKYISIDNTTIAPSATDEMITKEITSFEDHTIKVKVLQKFDKDQIIEVTAIEEGKEKPAGKLHVLANKYTSEIEILLVNCKTKINTTEKNGLPDADKAITELVLKNFLKQIYITPKFVYETLDLSIAPNINQFKTNHIFTGTEIIKSTSDMFDYCFNLLNYGNKNSSLVLFFFNEKGASVKEDGTLGGGLNGEAYGLGGAKGARIFIGGLRGNTIAHETLHSLGLRHSFDPEGDFTFKISYNVLGGFIEERSLYPTDNVMDYFKTEPPNEDYRRKLIWKWQMEKIYHTNNNGILYTKFES